MRALVLVVVLAGACKRTPEPTTHWWCWKDSVCFATIDDCHLAADAINPGAPCEPHATAYCTHGCTTGSGGTRCWPNCSVDRDACELDTARASSCHEVPPPEHPMLFPSYTEPGWWCGAIVGSAGVITNCEKYQELCETRGLELVGQRVTCTRATGPVYCWSRRQTGAGSAAYANKPAYVCSADHAGCELTLNYARTIKNPPPALAFEITSDCEVWKYD